jgi:hypothetical protein
VKGRSLATVGRESTNIYLHADMTHKQQAIDRAKPIDAKPGRYRPPTRSSASLRTSEYADIRGAGTPPKRRLLSRLGITIASA